MFHFIDQIDRNIFLFFNGLHCSFLDPIMWQISGRILWLPLYAILIWFIIRERKWNAVITLLAIALMIVLSDQISDLIKDSVQRFRPTHNPEIANIVHVVKDTHGHEYRGGDYGFVSSHAANMFATATFISLFFARKWITIAMFAWALLVVYSRIYLGVHYPFDILGGAMLGASIGALLFYGEQLALKKVTHYRKVSLKSKV